MVDLKGSFGIGNALEFAPSGVAVMVSTADPTTGLGQNGPVGSLYIKYNDPTIYMKINTGNTNWLKLIDPKAPGGTVLVDTGDTTGDFLNNKITVTSSTLASSVTNVGSNEQLNLTIANNVVLPGTGAVTLVSGTTGQRPGSPTNAMIRYNSTNNYVESYINSGWTILTTSPSGSAGILAITGDGTTATRTITAGTGITVTNGTGISGNPTISITSPLTSSTGGTGLSAIGSANQVLGVNNGATALEYKTVTAGTGISVTNGANSVTIANTGVTSVGLSMPAIFSVTGSPVTTTGTLTATLNSQAANVILAGPTVGSATPNFRALMYSDLPIKLYTENPSTPTANTVSGTNGVAVGNGTTASATNSIAFGVGGNSSVYGQTSFASGSFATAGDAQESRYVLRNITTNNTATELFIDGSTQRLVLPNNSLLLYRVILTGRRTDTTGDYCAFEISGALLRNASAATTALIGTPAKTTIVSSNAGYAVVVSADTTNGSLKITVTGVTSQTIRWVAVVRATQVTN